MFRDGRGAAVRDAVPRVQAEAGAQEELREVLTGQHVSPKLVQRFSNVVNVFAFLDRYQILFW